MSWKTLIIHAQYVVHIPKRVYVHWRVEIFASCLVTIYRPRHDKSKIHIQGECAHLEVQISNLPNSLDGICMLYCTHPQELIVQGFHFFQPHTYLMHVIFHQYSQIVITAVYIL